MIRAMEMIFSGKSKQETTAQLSEKEKNYQTFDSPRIYNYLPGIWNQYFTRLVGNFCSTVDNAFVVITRSFRIDRGYGMHGFD